MRLIISELLLKVSFIKDGRFLLDMIVVLVIGLPFLGSGCSIFPSKREFWDVDIFAEAQISLGFAVLYQNFVSCFFLFSRSKIRIRMLSFYSQFLG